MCTTINNKVYFFGGWYNNDLCYHNAIFQLDTSTYTWTQLQPTDDSVTVIKRANNGSMMSTEHEGQHRVLIIGGYGPMPFTQVPQAQYYQLPSGRISTNEHNLFDILEHQYIISYYQISLITVSVTACNYCIFTSSVHQLKGNYLYIYSKVVLRYRILI